MHIKGSVKNRSYRIAALLAVLFGFCGNAEAAAIKIESTSDSIKVGQTVSLSVVIDSEGVAVNNAGASIEFPSEYFDVLSVNKAGSVFSIWVEEPSFSNGNGIVAFDGGLPSPGFNGSRGLALSFVARAKKTGQAEIKFGEAAVRANDGLGTDVLKNRKGKIFNIIAAEPAAAPLLSSISALKLSSPTHPDQNQWYRDDDVLVTWSITSGIDSVQTVIGKNASTMPQVSYSPAIDRKTVNGLGDGIWYFKVRAGKNGEWGPVSKYVFKIDSTAPKNNGTEFSYESASKTLNIVSGIQDEISGINHYEIFLNGNLAKKVPADEFVDGKYSFPIDAAGENEVRLSAYDFAGNNIETAAFFNAADDSVPEPETAAATTSVDGSTSDNPPAELILPSEAPAVLSIDQVAPELSANEQLLISGRTQDANSKVTVNIRRGNEKPTVVRAQSNSEGNFFALTPKLEAGDYDIWLTAGSGDNYLSSAHLRTKVISRPLKISVDDPVTIAFGAVFLLAMIAAFCLGFNYRKIRRKLTMRNLVCGDAARMREIFAKYLEILQHVRRHRVLTKEEKEIKDNLEVDLEEIERKISRRKRSATRG
ncbi:MAG: hypothetical protein MUD10_03415 [Candidatus Pacebacteria bacterium]|nr:hypothetical protein [Candidatus Paceibacterota bacterium]